MSLKSDLVAAKALIDTPEKWCQGTYSIDDRSYCVLGASRKAVGLEAWTFNFNQPRYLAVYGVLQAVLPRGPYRGDVAAFNDAKRRKHSDIMALFDRAIVAAGDAS